MNSPRISIVMAAYNRADTLPRAIESVLRSEIPDWELIIVDDGSTDNTRAIIESYVAKDSRIRAAFHERNLHVHAAKNTGFDLMRGDWFTTLDSDDEMVPSALSSMLRLLEQLIRPSMRLLATAWILPLVSSRAKGLIAASGWTSRHS